MSDTSYTFEAVWDEGVNDHALDPGEVFGNLLAYTKRLEEELTILRIVTKEAINQIEESPIPKRSRLDGGIDSQFKMSK